MEHRCNECLLRKLAIFIISGAVRAKEIKRLPPSKSFWIESKKPFNGKPVYHGGDWHRETMQKIENHFLIQGFDVVREPDTHFGRADLGIYKKGVKSLMIEVGTMSLLKLNLNLISMPEIKYLIVPNDDYLIELDKVKEI